jgi:hypothetical protein
MQLVLMTQQASTIVVYTLSERSAVKQRSSSRSSRADRRSHRMVLPVFGPRRRGRSSRERSETGLSLIFHPGASRSIPEGQ